MPGCGLHYAEFPSLENGSRVSYFTDVSYFPDDPTTHPGNCMLHVGVWEAGISDHAEFELVIPDSSACFHFEMCALCMILEHDDVIKGRSRTRMLFVRNLY